MGRRVLIIEIEITNDLAEPSAYALPALAWARRVLTNKALDGSGRIDARWEDGYP